jgi:hypothetical protein
MRRGGRPYWLAASIASLWLGAVGCSQLSEVRREVAGGATVSGQQVLETGAAAPRVIYVANFGADPGAFKEASGLVSELLDYRPQIIAKGGVLGGRIGGSDNPDPSQVTDLLAASITQGLNDQQLGYPAERLAPGMALPSSGWLVEGRIKSVDPGNRAERAVVGFGEGAATAEVDVEVDRLGPGTQTPVLRFGSTADSGKAPGAVVTMNPYAAAAKFMIAKGATSRDIQAMGQEIAKQIADYARSRGIGAR